MLSQPNFSCHFATLKNEHNIQIKILRDQNEIFPKAYFMASYLAGEPGGRHADQV